MIKISTALIISTAVLALTACDGLAPKYDCSDISTVHSKQWNKQKRDYCTEIKIKSKQHSHVDGTTHIHVGGDSEHSHQMRGVSYDAEDVFEESDNDYSREDTTDYTEDNVELIGNVHP